MLNGSQSGRVMRVSLTIAGAGLVAIGLVGLASILWLGGLGSAHWSTALDPTDTRLPGWAITLSCAVLSLVGSLLLLARLRMRQTH